MSPSQTEEMKLLGIEIELYRNLSDSIAMVAKIIYRVHIETGNINSDYLQSKRKGPEPKKLGTIHLYLQIHEIIEWFVGCMKQKKVILF